MSNKHTFGNMAAERNWKYEEMEVLERTNPFHISDLNFHSVILLVFFFLIALQDPIS